MDVAGVLDAAGIADPGLRAAYAECRRLHLRFGRTYYLATRLLPAWKRPYVHALYGFARYADEIVDNGDPATRHRDFTQWCDRALTELRAGTPSDPVCVALAHTLTTWQIPLKHIEAFLASMTMDLTVVEYRTFAELRGYMYGSAAVIGLLMLPILEPVDDRAEEPARALGEAFQLTNFIRDVGEDLSRGRLYLPLEDLRRFGVRRSDLESGRMGPEYRELMRFQVERARSSYSVAERGISLLAASSRPCIATALTLYRGILNEVERADYRILDRRVRVGAPTRLRTVLPAYLQAKRAG